MDYKCTVRVTAICNIGDQYNFKYRTENRVRVNLYTVNLIVNRTSI